MTGNDWEVVAEYICDSDTPVIIAVADALATVEDEDVTEIDLTLYDYVPPDALDQLIDHKNPSGRVEVTFPVDDYLIEIKGENNVTIFE